MLLASILKYVHHPTHSLQHILADRERQTNVYCRVFYWFGEHYDTSLLIQALLMIIVQLTLLKVALDNRAPGTLNNSLEAEKAAHTPFQGYRARSASQSGGVGRVVEELLSGRRPWGFWRWRNSRQ
jgi:hypothetical protein